MDLTQTIAKNLNIPQHKVQNTVDLLRAENTIPFIARYRKEVTGNLDEVEIQAIQEENNRLENLEKRRKAVLSAIQESGNLSDELREQILQAETLTLLEDLYEPFRPKKRTRAMIAREKGLEPLANTIIKQPVTEKSLSDLISPFLGEQIPDEKTALEGASDIIAEIVSENTIIRQILRERYAKFGTLTSEIHKKADDKRQVFKDYYQFSQRLRSLQPHQVLAINRGEKEKILSVNVEIDEDSWKSIIFSQFPANKYSIFYKIFVSAVEDGAKRLLLPIIRRDARREIGEKAETHAIKVFAENLRSLLTQPPISDHVILGIDPGFRTGCKVAVIDSNGNLLDNDTIYPHPPKNDLEGAYGIILSLVQKYKVTLVVIGNGTASRETEQFIAEVTKNDNALSYIITSEAGASVYSASKTARKEFPDLDVSMRGAVSIARRVQDPLAELVKIDPKSIGVGLYQHDLNQTKLSEALDKVVESVVNAVGVEINTASVELLSYISGIGQSMAERIVESRQRNGPFKSRQELLQVSGMGPKTFEQSAGFLRIRNGDNPLDATAIHPEAYTLAEKIIKKLALKGDISSQENKSKILNSMNAKNFKIMAQELNAGESTLKDILDELIHPGRDPRQDLPRPILRKDVLSMEDLSTGMRLKGTIRNVVDFGAFVDIGVKIDGLLHRSKIPNNIFLKVGDVVDLIIVSVDYDRSRIALAMKEKTDK
jgi:uncharacterized protein